MTKRADISTLTAQECCVPSRNHHVGPFGFGCTQGVFKCSGCGHTWYRHEAMAQALDRIDIRPKSPDLRNYFCTLFRARVAVIEPITTSSGESAIIVELLEDAGRLPPACMGVWPRRGAKVISCEEALVP